MANRIEILLEVDPGGTGSAAIKRVTAQVKAFESAENAAGKAGRSFMDVFKGQVLADAFRTATRAAQEFVTTSLDAYAEGARSSRVLKSTANEAGIAYETADKAAGKLSETLALSETQGEKTYASIVRLAKGAGQLDKLPQITQAFADLAAARGLTATELSDRARQLQNLVDEGTDALFGKNPSAIYKEYAATMGLNVTTMSDMEKRQALVNELIKTGGVNAGEAALMLSSNATGLQKLAAAGDNLQRSFGEFLSKKTPVLDFLNDAAEVFSGKLSLGEMFTGQGVVNRIAAEQAALVKIAETKAIARNDAEEKLLKNQSILNRDPSQKYKSFELLAASGAQLTQAERNAAAMAGDKEGDELRKLREEALKRGTEQAEAIREGFSKSYKRLFAAGGGSDDLVLLDYAKKQFDQIKGIFDEAQAEEIGDKLNAALRKQLDRGLSYLKSVRAAAEGEFDTFGEAFADGENNPFAKIFNEGEKAAKRLREEFDALNITAAGKAQYDALEAAQKKNLETRLAGARVDASLSSARLRRQALELQSLIGLTAQEERRLSIQEKQITAALKIPELLARATAIDRGRPGIKEGSREQAGLINEQIQNLLGLGKQGGTGEFGERARSAIDKALISLFESLPEKMQRQISRSPMGQEFSGAYRREAGEQGREIQREIDRAAAADRAVAGIQQDLDIIRRGGLPSGEQDRRILAVTGALSEKELTGDMRGARFDALIRDADRQAKLEETGRALAEATKEAIDSLTQAVDDLATAAKDPENRKILIETINKSKASVREELYGSAK